MIAQSANHRDLATAIRFTQIHKGQDPRTTPSAVQGPEVTSLQPADVLQP